MLGELGHHVTMIDRSMVALSRACPQGPQPWLVPLAARVEALPFDPWSFDVALFCQNLHQTPPRPMLTEIARVLAPGGSIACVYTIRDDSVPWVRRLAAVVREVDPDAMKGDYGSDSTTRIDESHYFPTVEHASFRTWFPVTREGMLTMIGQRQAVAALAPEARERLLASVGAIYDEMSRPPEPLLLPYEAACTRAEISHDELTEPITWEDGLRIL